MSQLPYKIVDEGLRLRVFLSPKASRDEIVGVELIGDERCGEIAVIRARVRALPDKGLANKAVLKLFAKWLGVAKSSLELISGSKARHKILLVGGDGAELAGLVDQMIDEK